LTKSNRVLLVDDEQQFVAGLAKILALRGFDVSTAFSGYEAVDAVRSQGCFDVVVLDIKMPGMDGIATLTEIKKLAPSSKVIMLTGYASLESGTKAMRLGACDYLMKPCDIEDLIEKIRDAQDEEHIKSHPVQWKRKTVGAITLPLIVRLYAEEPLIKALRMMGSQSGQEVMEEAYILDREGRLQGIVTRRDLLTEAQKSHPDMPITWNCVLENPEFLPRKAIRDIMRKDPITTSPDGSIAEAAQLMIKHNIRCMPVVSSGKVVGYLRLQDALRSTDHEVE